MERCPGGWEWKDRVKEKTGREAEAKLCLFLHV